MQYKTVGHVYAFDGNSGGELDGIIHKDEAPLAHRAHVLLSCSNWLNVVQQGVAMSPMLVRDFH